MIVLLTGVAGFIGFHTARALAARGVRVIGVDCLTDHYDVRLKHARLARLAGPDFEFHQLDIADPAALAGLVAAVPDITHIVHLAAQAGVRYSMQQPYAFVHSNVMGQVAMLEAARQLPGLRHFVFASSSSVYGLNAELPFAETAAVDSPASLYAATKRADELIGHAYAHLYALPQTGLRFFTAYGPWGRPDMAYYAFAEAILAGTPLTLYEGALKRDFTYIDDIVAGVLGVLDQPPPPGPPRLLNIGNNRTETVQHLIDLLETSLGRKAVIRRVPRPAADVAETWADIGRIAALTGYRPATPLAVGIPRFVEWLLAYRAGDDTALQRGGA